uniref:Aspartate/glutamate/uridylate kinase domain-containing protein n=1 Tax=Aegilops tauschii subsp. strangulata TaxID=200361 RepID=A0A453M8M1_AEGTS
FALPPPPRRRLPPPPSGPSPPASRLPSPPSSPTASSAAGHFHGAHAPADRRRRARPPRLAAAQQLVPGPPEPRRPRVSASGPEPRDPDISMATALRLAAVARDSPAAVSKLGRERASLCAIARPGGQCFARRGLVLRCQSGAAAAAATISKGGAADGAGAAAGFTVVMKFGGSSLASAARMREVADLILSFPEETPVVVLSAMGKTTNNLLL